MRLHPVCSYCLAGDHEACIEEQSDGAILCSCIDEYHFDDEDADDRGR